MDFGAILLVLAIILLVGIYISKPFFETEKKQTKKVVQDHEVTEHRRSMLLAERDRLLNALEELDFDHVLKKIPTDEYPLQRAALLKAGADVLRRLDSFQEQTPVSTAEARLEEAISMRRADTAQNDRREGGIDPGEDELEEMISTRRQTHTEKAAGFCPSCGRAIQTSDQFCPKCGARV